MQSLFLGAAIAVSCQEAEKQDKAAGKDWTFLFYKASEPSLSNLAESSQVQTRSEVKAEEQVVAPKPSWATCWGPPHLTEGNEKSPSPEGRIFFQGSPQSE